MGFINHPPTTIPKLSKCCKCYSNFYYYQFQTKNNIKPLCNDCISKIKIIKKRKILGGNKSKTKKRAKIDHSSTKLPKLGSNRCPAIISSGERKGRYCNKPFIGGNFCSSHKNYLQRNQWPYKANTEDISEKEPVYNYRSESKSKSTKTDRFGMEGGYVNRKIQRDMKEFTHFKSRWKEIQQRYKNRRFVKNTNNTNNTNKKNNENNEYENERAIPTEFLIED